MYPEQTFNIPQLQGISQTTTEEHLKLYAGYVKNTNLVLQKISELSKDESTNVYTLGELQRRFSFEFNGMKNHEIFFKSFEGGPSELSADSSLKEKITNTWGSYDIWLSRFKAIAKTRGIGWAILSYDKQTDTLINSWTDEQHIGQLIGVTPILMIDMWEHSFVADYQPSGKGNYIEDFFKNLNWQNIEKNFSEAQNK